MKVVADRYSADPEPLDQVMVNEILRRGSGPGLVEGHHDSAGEPGSSQQPQLSGLVGEPELGLFGLKKLRGCGSKVTASAGRPWARPICRAAAITARWPRCTPSKLPIATTAPFGMAVAGVVSRITVKTERHFRDSSTRAGWGRDRDLVARTKSSRAQIGVLAGRCLFLGQPPVNGLFNG